MLSKGCLITRAGFSVLLLATLFFHGLVGLAQAQDNPLIKNIKISGNIRVEEDGIRLHLKSRAGEAFNSATVEQDVKSIYRMGFFDDVQVVLSPEGELIFAVKEKPYIREVRIQGNANIGREKIETALGVAPRTILDRAKVGEGVEKIRKLYSEQGYVNVQVDHVISLEANNQALVMVDITEGTRLLIKKITFEGNRAFQSSDLAGLMNTKEEWIFSFITNRGVLDRDMLTNDVAILTNHYYDHGYIDLKIDEPRILRGRGGLEILIRIEEGQQYRVGKVEIGGDLIQDGPEMLKRVTLTTGQIFRGSRLRQDISSLTEVYTNKGFAFAQVEPVTKVNPEDKNVDVALVIRKGPPVYFNRIQVAGNTRTRDYVVRRELAASEQELYSGNKLTQSRNALQRTGYFEDVQLTTKKTDQPDTVDLLVDVKEGSTGQFTIGAGYSSGDGFLFNAGIAEKNFMGRGQSISGSSSLGTSRQDFILSFTDPYFRDSRLSLGFDAFNTKKEYSDFDERKLGFGVRTSYPLNRVNFPFFRASKKEASIGSDELAVTAPPTMWDYLRGTWSYELTREKISDIDSSAPSSIQNEKGTSLTSAMTPGLSYDSRDHFFTPTEGTRSAFSVKVAGLGGDNRFIRSDLSGKWYYPLLKDPNWGGAYVLALGGSLGYGVSLGARHNGEDNLPLFERYFTGGLNSVRGFAERSLGPKEGDDVIGGDKLLVTNAEFHFPIMEKFGLRGLLFFDMGQAFRESESISFADLRRSVGFGARWISPFGPLRVELGFPLNKQSGDDTSLFGFSVGALP
jgi:outer membrane protein insertion porin family